MQQQLEVKNVNTITFYIIYGIHQIGNRAMACEVEIPNPAIRNVKTIELWLIGQYGLWIAIVQVIIVSVTEAKQNNKYQLQEK